MQDLNPLYEAVVSGDAQTAQALTDQALAANVSPLRIQRFLRCDGSIAAAREDYARCHKPIRLEKT